MTPIGHTPFTSADAAAGIWRRLARPFEITEVVDAMMGLRPSVVEAFAALKLCSSAEVAALLAAMPSLSRALTTSISSQAVRTRGEVRGPVLWSETISARAASCGDEGLFVCAAPQREYDTPANRVLVLALRRIAASAGAIDHAPEAWHRDPRVGAARAVARSARSWADHASLSGVSAIRVDARAITQVRGSKSAARYAPALAVVENAAEPLGPEDLVALCDRRTRLQHWVLLAIVDELEARGLSIPPFRAEGGALLAGPITYVNDRHRMGPERLHGIVLGDVLIDVAYWPPGTSSKTERAAELIRTYADVRDTVDRAIRLARRTLG